MSKKPLAMRYRVALFHSPMTPYTVTADNEDQMEMCMQDPRFMEWLTDWQQVVPHERDSNSVVAQNPENANNKTPGLEPFGYVTPGDIEDYKYYGLAGPTIGPKDDTRTVPVYLEQE